MKCYSGVAVLAVAFTSFFYCLSIQTTLAAGEVATVIAEHGQTLVRQVGSSTYKALLVQDELHAGDIVKTSADGEADILFSDGSQLKLDSRTSIRITKSATAPHSFNLFQAVVGVIWAHLRPGQTIQTPSANIVVRGTEVELAVAGDGTSQLTVLSGNVSFYNAEGSIDLETGQQSTASPGSAPTAPIAVDPSGLISWTGDVVGMPLVFELGAHEGGQVPSAVLSAREVSLTTQTAAARNDAALWVQLGDTRRILGDTVGAQSAYASALNVAPGDPGGSEGLALTDMSQGNQGEALQALRPISSKPYGMAIRGLIEIESGNTDIAAQDLQAALSTDPTLYAAEDLLALIYLQHGNLTGAEKLARSAQVTAPRSPQALGTLSTVLLLEGNVKEATKDANAAVAIDPRSPFALLALGRTLVMGMRYEDARSVYERGLAYCIRISRLFTTNWGSQISRTKSIALRFPLTRDRRTHWPGSAKQCRRPAIIHRPKRRLTRRLQYRRVTFPYDIITRRFWSIVDN
jgi:Flp pilus assembly protein TadD